MTRRSSRLDRVQPRRSMLVIAIVILAALGLGLAFLPGAMAPPAPLNCPFGEVILNGVRQCLAAPPPSVH
jgi:hypothetical protein